MWQQCRLVGDGDGGGAQKTYHGFMGEIFFTVQMVDMALMTVMSGCLENSSNSAFSLDDCFHSDSSACVMSGVCGATSAAASFGSPQMRAIAHWPLTSRRTRFTMRYTIKRMYDNYALGWLARRVFSGGQRGRGKRMEEEHKETYELRECFRQEEHHRRRDHVAVLPRRG